MLLCTTCSQLGACGCGPSETASPPSTGCGEPECEVEPFTGTGAADTAQPQAQTRTWSLLSELWAPSGTPMARVKDNMWVGVVCAAGMCREWPRREGAARPFGQEANDFALLAAAVEWEFPGGIAVVNLDKQTCIVCVPGRPMQTADVDSAVSWLRCSRGQTLGVALKTVGARLQSAFVNVQYTPRCDAKDDATRRRKVLAAVDRLRSEETHP